MVAKDANDHPLHDLAGSLARKAVLAVGSSVADAWEGKGSAEKVVACASKYFAHPSYTTEFDNDVTRWAAMHGDEIQRPQIKGAALKRAREHRHGEHEHGDHGLPKQIQTAWTFWTQHYASLTGRQDMLSSPLQDRLA